MPGGIDAYRLVGEPAELERAGLFVAEGRLIVERLLLDGRFRVHSVVVTPPAAAALADVFRQRPEVHVDVVDPDVLQEITGFDFHRGCLALAHRPAAPMAAADLVQATRLLAIEGVGNPDNVGGLFRTAAAFGIDGVLLNRASGDPLYRKAIRTAMGASLRVPYARADAWLPALAQFRERGFKIVALTPSAGARSLSEVAATVAKDERLIVLVGAEGPGLDAETIALADVAVRIPMDNAVDSLNVVVAAGIALHALVAK